MSVVLICVCQMSFFRCFMSHFAFVCIEYRHNKCVQSQTSISGSLGQTFGLKEPAPYTITGWWLSPTPLNNMSLSVGIILPNIYRKIKNCPNHQPVLSTCPNELISPSSCLCSTSWHKFFCRCRCWDLLLSHRRFSAHLPQAVESEKSSRRGTK